MNPGNCNADLHAEVAAGPVVEVVEVLPRLLALGLHVQQLVCVERVAVDDGVSLACPPQRLVGRDLEPPILVGLFVEDCTVAAVLREEVLEAPICRPSR